MNIKQNGKKVLMTISLVILAVLALVACKSSKEKDNRDKANPPIDVRFTIGADKISVDASSGYIIEYSLDNVVWQAAEEFTGLLPNTEYTIYVRVKENAEKLASDPYSETVKTLKHNSVAPGAVEYEQADKKITLTTGTNDNLEYSFDGGVTYAQVKEHNFTEVGEKTVKIRYKETSTSYHSEAYELKVFISNYFSGNGKKENPFIIKTYEHLKAMEGVKDFAHSEYFKLNNDISFAGKLQLTKPIGIKFSYFDGNNKKISNIRMSYRNRDGGLFDYAQQIKDLTLENVTFDVQLTEPTLTEELNFGVLTGQSRNITNCHVINATMKIKRTEILTNDKILNIGGLVGKINYDTTIPRAIINSSCDAGIFYDSPNSGQVLVGGLVGLTYGPQEMFFTISSSFSKGAIDVIAEYAEVGGIAGRADYAKIEDCYSSVGINGNVAEGDGLCSSFGGICGNDAAEISRSYSTSAIKIISVSQTIYTGGIIGFDDGIVVNKCFFAGSITAEISEGDRNSYVGTIIAPRDVNGLHPLNTVTDCYYASESVFDESDLKTVVHKTHATEIGDAFLKSDTWQKENLGYSDQIWKIEDGFYPTIK